MHKLFSIHTCIYEDNWSSESDVEESVECHTSVKNESEPAIANPKGKSVH